MKKSVLIITINQSLQGGTERAIANLYKMCSNEVYFSILSICSKNEDNNPYDINKNNIINMGIIELQTTLIGKIKWYINCVNKINKYLKTHHYDFILTYGHNMSIMSPFLKSRGAKKFACEHINFDTIPSVSKFIMRLSYPLLNGVIALSSTAKKKMTCLNKNIFIIHNCNSFYSEVRSNLNSKRIIMIGRLSAEKGYERLVPIAKYISLHYPDWRIDIFGNGDIRNELEKLYEKESLSNIINLKGNTDNVKEELLNSDILFMTSYTEALPMAIIEAKVLGVPTIAYRCEGTEELIHNSVDGFIVDTFDEFIFCINQLIKDYSLRKELGENAFLSSKEFSPEAVKKDWLNIFDVKN